jgi:hypothetical protein
MSVGIISLYNMINIQTHHIKNLKGVASSYILLLKENDKISLIMNKILLNKYNTLNKGRTFLYPNMV